MPDIQWKEVTLYSFFRIALYAAQLILALEHLHAQNIIFKELSFILSSLKP